MQLLQLQSHQLMRWCRGGMVASPVQPTAAAACRLVAQHARTHRRGASVRAASGATAAASTPAASDQAARAAQLKAWVLQHSHQLPTDLTPQPSAGGYGMVAGAAVGKGQVLVRVPRTLMMTAESAAADPEYGELAGGSGLTEWQALLLHLLCERAKGAASFWAPYLSMLPDQSHHPLLWGEDRLAWLKGSPMEATLRSRQRQVKEDTEALVMLGANDLPIARAWAAAHGGAELVTEASVGWAAATLLSRAFSLDMAGDEAVEGDLSYFGTWQAHAPDALALVPWADMLAHSSEASHESCLRYSAELQAAALCAHKDYSQGQEVYDSYGPGLCPSDLLLDYGFVDEGNTNHRVEVDPSALAAPQGARAKALIAALAAAQGAAPAQAAAGEGPEAGSGTGPRVPLGEEGPDATTLAWVRAALSSDVELIKAGWRVKAGPKDVDLALRVMGDLSEPSSCAQEEKVLKAVASYAQAALGRYPSTLEQDLQELADPGTPWLRQQVLRALTSEKKALVGCVQAVDAWLARLQEGCNVEDLYDWGEEYEGDDDEGEMTWSDEDDGWGDQPPARGPSKAGKRG